MGRFASTVLLLGLLLPPHVHHASQRGKERPSVFEPLGLELDVRAGASDYFLDVEALLRFRRLDPLEPVRLRLRADYTVKSIFDEQGRPLRFERNHEWITVRTQESEPGTERRWRLHYRWPLHRPLAQVGGVLAYKPWYPRIQDKPDRDDPTDLPLPATIRVHLPEPWVAISAGRLTIEQDEGVRTWIWRQPFPRLVHPLVVGRFSVDERVDAETTCRLYLAPQTPAPSIDLAAYVLAARAYFRDVFGDLGLGDYSVAVAPLPDGQRGLTVLGLTLLSTANFESGRPFPYRVVAHEVAHNWWNLEVPFPGIRDAWLKEGLPTYSAMMFLEDREGPSRLAEELESSRQTVLKVTSDEPLAAGFEMRFEELLHSQTYHKAAWVLHMLRRRLGDESFLELLRQLYEEYRGIPATTADFERLALARDPALQGFFDYWLREAAIPGFRIRWSKRADAEGWQIRGRIKQIRPALSGPVTLRVLGADGAASDTTVELRGRKTSFEIRATSEPTRLELDPHGDLLYREVQVLSR